MCCYSFEETLTRNPYTISTHISICPFSIKKSATDSSHVASRLRSSRSFFEDFCRIFSIEGSVSVATQTFSFSQLLLSLEEVYLMVAAAAFPKFISHVVPGLCLRGIGLA